MRDRLAPRICDCGSGKMSVWLFDGYGYELCRACPDCEEKQLARFRPDIMEAYDAEEPLEPEDY